MEKQLASRDVAPAERKWMVNMVHSENGVLARRHAEVAHSQGQENATILLHQVEAKIVLEKPLKLKLVTKMPALWM